MNNRWSAHIIITPTGKPLSPLVKNIHTVMVALRMQDEAYHLRKFVARIGDAMEYVEKQKDHP